MYDMETNSQSLFLTFVCFIVNEQSKKQSISNMQMRFFNISIPYIMAAIQKHRDLN